MYTNLKSCHQSNEIDVEVQIIGLKDIYNKKTRKTLKGSENRLEDSEVTVVVQATENITCLRAYIQRCPEAAIKTHDTIGWKWQAYLLFCPICSASFNNIQMGEGCSSNVLFTVSF